MPPTIRLVVTRNHIEDIINELPEIAAEVVTWGCERVAQELQDSLVGSGPQEPSSPGNPPNNQTHELSESIAPVSLGPLHGGVEMLEYGGMLEDGTDFIEPRPWIRPAVERVRPEYTEEMGRAIEQGVRRIAR
jgi:hypothetical protein